MLESLNNITRVVAEPHRPLEALLHTNTMRRLVTRDDIGREAGCVQAGQSHTRQLGKVIL